MNKNKIILSGLLAILLLLLVIKNSSQPQLTTNIDNIKNSATTTLPTELEATPIEFNPLTEEQPTTNPFEGHHKKTLRQLRETPVNQLQVVGIIASKHVTWAILKTIDDEYFSIDKNSTLNKHKVRLINFQGITLANKQHLNYHCDQTQPLKSFSLSAQNIPAGELLTLLAQFNQTNIIIQPDLDKPVSMNLFNINWQQALDLILKTQGLAKWQTDNTLFIGKSDHIISLEKKASAVSNEQKIVAKLDQPSKQINIQAYIMSIDDSYEKEIGARLGFSSIAQQNSTSESNLTPTSNPTDQLQFDLPNTTTNAGNLGMVAFTLAKNTLLNLELSALESEGHAEMIANPHLTTANQQTAMIESGEEIPYQESSRNGGTTSNFKKAVLKLEVTPQITAKHKMLLHIKVNQDQPTRKSVLGVPTINTRQISTQIDVDSGQTIVLGGIIEESDTNNDSSVPFLGKLPILGWFFHHKQHIKRKRQLLIFVTPTIAN